MSDERLEILQYSYWEHFKAAKDLSLILPITHPKRIELQNTIDLLITEIAESKTNEHHEQ